MSHRAAVRPGGYAWALDLQGAYQRDLPDIFPLGFNRAEPQEQYHITEALHRSEPYYWAPDLCQLVTSIAASIPGHWELHRKRLPSAAGFFAFASPLIVNDVRIPTMAWYLDGTTLEIVAFWQAWDDSDEEWLQLTHWREGTTLASMLALQSSRDDPMSHISGDLFRTIAASFALLEQELLLALPRSAPRAWQRRSENAGRTSLVRIVTLRHLHMTRGRGGGADEILWTCRWFVRGHWRDQWHPRLGRHQPCWILPHIKGPEDKPLKAPTARLFAVIR